jgi:integrase
MKMIDDVIIIGIDSGYGNIKTANCCFPASVSAYDKEPVFKENLLVYESKFYLIGEGHKEFLADKTRDLDYYVLALAAIARELNIHYHAVIYQALKYAMKTDMVPQNVAMKVDRPRKNSFQPTFLDAEQMQKLFEVVKGTRLELPVLVAAFYGLRRGEVLGLKWDAIDFNRGTLTIKRTVTEATIDGTMKIIEQDSAKSKSSLRTLPLVGSFRDYFQKVKEAQELNKKVCGNCYNYEYDGYVFVNELGERMRPNYLTEYFPKYIAKHGMPKMRFHDLRHPYVKHTTKNKATFRSDSTGSRFISYRHITALSKISKPE